MSTHPDLSFLRSSLLVDSPLLSFAEVEDWVAKARGSESQVCKRIPFASLEKWSFTPDTGDLAHESGKFFRIEGLRVKTNAGTWDQPIMNQPEVGILGLLTKEIDGVRYFLMSAKPEPGNIGEVQIAPTLQATRSNYTQVHGGALPPFLEYFASTGMHRAGTQVLHSERQSEQGARFLRKQNQNMLVDISIDVPEHEHFRWLTLGQLKALLRIDNLVNMEARSVLSSVSVLGEDARHDPTAFNGVTELLGCELSAFGCDLLQSLVAREERTLSNNDIRDWLTREKARATLDCSYLPLSQVKNWEHSNDAIAHESGDFFSVIAVSTETKNREVASWTQPLVAHPHIGAVGFVAQKKNGVLHFLAQAKVEAGSRDVVELAPTVSCSSPLRAPDSVPFLEYFVEASDPQIRFSTLLSEEGGRFYRVQNRYSVVELTESEELHVPENFAWITAGQLFEFTREPGVVNIEARTLLACLGIQ